MTADSHLLRCLQRLSGGDKSNLLETLGLLADTVLLTPILTPQVVAFESGVTSIDALTISYGSRRMVPCFTSVEFFLDWTAGRYDSLNLLASDLALTLPTGCNLFINPGTADWLELSPAEVSELTMLNGGERVARPSSIECGNVVRYEYQGSGKLERDITEILVGYQEVQEGYFLPAANYPTSGIIGLLTQSMHTDKRFLLLSEISEISKRYFGAGNALEVFDEIDFKTSSLWDLFNTVPPFYRASDNIESTQIRRAVGWEEPSMGASSMSQKNRPWFRSLVSRFIGETS